MAIGKKTGIQKKGNGTAKGNSIPVQLAEEGEGKLKSGEEIHNLVPAERLKPSAVSNTRPDTGDMPILINSNTIQPVEREVNKEVWRSIKFFRERYTTYDGSGEKQKSMTRQYVVKDYQNIINECIKQKLYPETVKQIANTVIADLPQDLRIELQEATKTTLRDYIKDNTEEKPKTKVKIDGGASDRDSTLSEIENGLKSLADNKNLVAEIGESRAEEFSKKVSEISQALNMYYEKPLQRYEKLEEQLRDLHSFLDEQYKETQKSVFSKIGKFISSAIEVVRHSVKGNSADVIAHKAMMSQTLNEIRGKDKKLVGGAIGGFAGGLAQTKIDVETHMENKKFTERLAKERESNKDTQSKPGP